MKDIINPTLEAIISPKSLEPICHVILNYTVHDDLQPHPEYLAKLRQCQKSSLFNCGQFDTIELQAHQYDMGWIEYLNSRHYRYAVIWFDGCWPTGDDWDKNLIDIINNDWAANDWLVAGHIIDRGTKIPYWHHQCVVLNLKAWEKIGCPDLFQRPKQDIFYDVSEEKIHDGYTPVCVYPNGNTLAKLFKDDFFDSTIAVGLANGLKIHNLPFSLRDDKACVYPEDEIEETLEWIHDNTMADRLDINDLRSQGDDIGEDKAELYGFKLLKYQIVYITNTEGVPDLRHDVQYTTLAVPCSGLHQFAHMANSLKSAKRVVWFDFNPYSVKWMEHLVTHWDGRNFSEWFEDNKHVILDDGVILEQNLIYELDLIEEFIESQGGEEQWVKTFNKIKRLEHVFLNIDAVKEWDKLADAIGNDDCVFLQLTNIWNYEVNYLNTDGLDAQINFLQLLNTVQKNNKELYLMGDTPGWIHHRNTRIKELKVIN